jgi:hypothetical protein
MIGSKNSAERHTIIEIKKQLTLFACLPLDNGETGGSL